MTGQPAGTQIPLPAPDAETEPYWAALRERRLSTPHCRACGRHFLPASNTCPYCLSDEVGWRPVSGRGTVYSFVVFHHVYHPAFAGRVPYNVAIIELEEGPHLFSNVVGCDRQALRVGLPVEVVYETVNDAITLPKFQPRLNPSEEET